MTPTRGPLEQSSLFDLDLAAATESEAATVAADPTLEATATAPPDAGSAQSAGKGTRLDSAEADTLAQPRFEEREFGDREAKGLQSSRLAMLYAAAVDGVVHAAVALIALVGLRVLGVQVGMREVPAILLLLWIFSLIYSVIPLAFWGRTLGLTAVGLTASADGHRLTFSQATRRWLASCLTVALLGLPWLLLLSGRSLGDRLSGSTTEFR